MILTRTNIVFLFAAIFIIILFSSSQFFLTGRLHADMKISSSIMDHYQVSEANSGGFAIDIPSTYFEEEVTYGDAEVLQETLPTKETVEASSVVTTTPPTRSSTFNPVGIPFLKNKWYRLFRYYQSKTNNTNAEFIQSILSMKEASNPWILLQREDVDVLFIRQGCVDTQRRKIVIFDPSTNSDSSKQRLRSVVPPQSLSSLSFAGFESYTIAEAQLPLPTRLSSNGDKLTWVLATPPLKEGSSECMDAFLQYIPLFIQAMHPFLPNQVCWNNQ